MQSLSYGLWAGECHGMFLCKGTSSCNVLCASVGRVATLEGHANLHILFTPRKDQRQTWWQCNTPE